MEYALYKGDDLLCIGTAEEIAKEMQVKVSTVKWYLTQSYQKRMDKMKNKDNAVVIIKLDDDGED